LATVRELTCEILYSQGREEESFKYSAIGMTDEKCKELLLREQSGIYEDTIGDRFKRMYMVKQIPYSVFKFMRDTYSIYINGAKNMDGPLSILHNLNLLFLEGLRLQKPPIMHTATPATHLETCTAHMTALLLLAQKDVPTQGISHFNYHLAHFIEKVPEREYRKVIEGFIKDLSRLYIFKPHDPVYSCLNLDMNISNVKGKVIYDEAMEKHNFEEYHDTAITVAKIVLEEFSHGYDEGTWYLYPHLFFHFKREDIDKMDLEMLKLLLLISLKSGCVYIGNLDSGRNSDHEIGYASDLTRFEIPREIGLLSACCSMGISINLLSFAEKKYDWSRIESEFENILTHIHTLISWKNEQLKSRIYNNNFFILNRDWNSLRPNNYFEINKEIDDEERSSFVSLRFPSFGDLRRLMDRYTQTDDFDEKLIEFLKLAHKQINEIGKSLETSIKLGQIPSQSGAFHRFSEKSKIISEYDVYNLVFPLILHYDKRKNTFFSGRREDIFKNEVARDAKVHELLNSGCVTRIFINQDLSNLEKRRLEEILEEFRGQLQICFKAGLRLINYRSLIPALERSKLT
jgi:anaerobic ribonucleoside-triphosphate reductase